MSKDVHGFIQHGVGEGREEQGLAVEAGALDYRSPLPDNRTSAIGSLKMESTSHSYPAQWIGSAVPLPYA